MTTAEASPEKTQPQILDPVTLAHRLAELAERSQHIGQIILQQQQGKALNVDPLNMAQAWMAMGQHFLHNPKDFWEAQAALARDYFSLWQYTSQRLLGEHPTPVAAPDSTDKRFKAAEWQENPVFDYLKQSYLLTTQWLQDVLEDAKDELSSKDRLKVDFVVRQLSDALSPSNFAATNPEVLRATLESGGENLVKGLENLLNDLERGKGHLLIKMTDPNAFVIGENVAASAGEVVFENEMLQLIQYKPLTEQAFKTPLLIIPPWINKFYILDMREKNSLIRWANEQGHTVFIISWANGDAKLADKNFENYLSDGILPALDAIEAQTGEKAVNAIGYCIGGTLLACTLAWLEAKGQASRVASATYYVTLVDFSDPGDLGVFIDEGQIRDIEAKMAANGGYLDAYSMHSTFNYLRPNDLIWSFVINNYLLGKDPFPFDLLFWNSDSTCLPAKMHSYYLRKMYMENKLIEPNALTMHGVPLDLRTIKTPSMLLSTQEDHIAPWKGTYTATQIYGGPIEFVLSGSGHIAGVINPPASAKYFYLTNPELPADPEKWLASAKRTEGSWWGYWEQWVEKFAGGKIPARDPAKGKLKAIEPAPGRYVKVRNLG